MKKKITAVATLLLASSLVLAGCSDQEASSDNVQSFKDTGKDNSNNGLIPATDKSKIPAAAKQRTDTFIAGISQPEGVFNPYFYHNGWDGNVTGVMFDSLVDVDRTGKP
ncbi:MAG: ABC transporter substrate-binding protein, partial [Tumebacillaceae bacterium]